MLKNIFAFLFFLTLLFETKTLSYQDNLLRKVIEKNEGENIMISPLSLYQLLSLLSNGTSGETQKEIFQVLYPGKTIDNNFINKLNKNINEVIIAIESEDSKDSTKISDCLEGDDCQIHFNDVNGIFTKKDVELTNQFKQICNNYNTSFYELISAEQINNFCSENTNGKINQILNDIDLQTIMILVNVIYFKGTWSQKFNKENTEKKIFTNYDKTKVKVDTMHQKYLSSLYYEDNNVQIISLPYISNKLDFSMIIILPNKDKYSSPLDYLNKEKITLSEIYSKLESKANVHLYLPKFKYEFQQNLNEILDSLGMKSAFIENGANFENLCENVDTYVNSIFQNTYINVNENGTEAAAITAVIMEATSIPPKKEYYMKVNHSFIYMIKSNIIKDVDDKEIMPFIGIVHKLEGENVDDKDEDEDEDEDEDPIPINHTNNRYILKVNISVFISLIILILS